MLTLSLSTVTYSHGGGLNASGCHNERRTGGYHCHRSSYTPTARASVRRPSTSSLVANPLSPTSGSSDVSASYVAKQATNILILERQKNVLLLKVDELERENKNLLLKIQMLEQEKRYSFEGATGVIKIK